MFDFLLHSIRSMQCTNIALGDLASRSPNANHTLFLMLAQPGLLGLPEHAFPEIIDKVSHHDEHECDGIHPVYMEIKDLEPNNDAPKVTREKRNVEECRAGQTVEDWNKRVEQCQNERVTGQISTSLAIPGRIPKSSPVEDPGLGAIDDHPPEAKLPDDFVKWSLTDEVLLGHVAQAVECCASQGKEVTLELVASADRTIICCSCDMVAGQQQAHASDADEDSKDLRPVVAHTKENKGHENDNDNCPEVDQLGGKNSCVTIGEHGEIVPLYIAKGKDDV